jgi:hypothetical protein
MNTTINTSKGKIRWMSIGEPITEQPSAQCIQARLNRIRESIDQENVSYGELVELESLKDHIHEGDLELLQWAGVPEYNEEKE